MPTYQQEIRIPVAGRMIAADLVIPHNAGSIIVFAHAGIDSRHNRLNKIVAGRLQEAGYGTLLPNLLEAGDLARAGEFDIGLLAMRLTAVTQWLKDRDLFGHYGLGYYATTMGAAAALQSAADTDTPVSAIVCRSGRPDLARDAVPEVRPPILFIVGSLDKYVLQMNREALEWLSGEKKLTVVQGASHFFDDEKIGEVSDLAVGWFRRYLVRDERFVHRASPGGDQKAERGR